MSMNTAIVYGFGFNTVEVKNSTILKFLKNHINSINKTICKGDELKELLGKIDMDKIEAFSKDEDADEFDEMDEILPFVTGDEDIFCDLECDTSDRFLNYVADIIGIETDVYVNYERAQSDECEGYPCILLPKCFPWNFTETESKLTRESLSEILEPYKEELGISDEETDDKTVEYYG